MTNPNNIVRVRARNGGRSSVYEANAAVQPFSQGLLSGNGVLQNTSANMNVLVGGSSTAPDILIAENPAGYKVILDVVGQQSVAITAPASNSRISSVVAYTDDLALSSTETNITGSPSTCGLIVVNGDSASSPVAPDDTAIRAAITADGATGSQASYVVIATIRVSSTTTTITNSLITIQKAGIGSDNVDWATLTYPETEHRIGTWSNAPLYAKKIILTNTALNANTRTRISLGFGFRRIIDSKGYIEINNVSIPIGQRWVTDNLTSWAESFILVDNNGECILYIYSQSGGVAGNIQVNIEYIKS